MKKFYLLFCLFINSVAFAQVPLLVEDFDYPAADLLTAHGWIAHSGGTTNPVAVTAPDLTFAGYVGSGVGLSAGVNNTGQDVNKAFIAPASGSVYASFLVNSTANAGKGGYFFHFRDEAAGTAFRARTFIATETGKMKVGLSFNASAMQDSISTLNFGETYLFVVKYTIVDGAENDVVSLYIFKAGDDLSSEPAIPTLGPMTATRTTPGDISTPLGPDISPMEIVLRQFEAAQKITVDGFRVKTNWDLAKDEAISMVTSTSTLSLLAPDQSTNSFDITSNTSWTALSDQPWLTLSSGSGSGNATIIATVTENVTADKRTATVTVSAAGVPDQIVTVTQEAPLAMSVSINTLTISALINSTNTFDIASNTDWTVASNQTWVAISSVSGTGNATITLTAEENLNTSVRSANVTVSAVGLPDQIIVVTQDAAAVALTVSSNTLSVASSANSTNTFDITSNTDWTATSDQIWLTLSSGSGTGNATITITASENLNTSTRSANVTVSAAGLSDQIISVTQNAVGLVLTVSSNTLSLAASANSTNTFDITSNTDWTAASDQAWLTLSSGSGTGNATITLTASVNTVALTRSATVTVSAANVATQTITVTQDASATGLSQINSTHFNVYPNPVSNGLLNISILNNDNLKQIEIFNGIGKRIRTELTSENIIDIRELKSGIYYLRVKEGSQIFTSKFIME